MINRVCTPVNNLVLCLLNGSSARQMAFSLSGIAGDECITVACSRDRADELRIHSECFFSVNICVL
jgi:hypothetical protein